MNLIYCCAFYNPDYHQLVDRLLESFSLHEHNDTHFLIMCHPEQIDTYKGIIRKHNVKKAILYTQPIQDKFHAACARLQIFTYPEIDKYQKILYVDCDVLVMNSLNSIFNQQLKNKLYVCREGYCAGFHWDSNFKLPRNVPAPRDGDTLFTSAMLLFNNNKNIKSLFIRIKHHITDHIKSNNQIMPGLDQPFIVYNAFVSELYDNKLLVNSKHVLNLGLNDKPDCYKGQTIVHFAGNLGDHTDKIKRIDDFNKQTLTNA